MMEELVRDRAECWVDDYNQATTTASSRQCSLLATSAILHASTLYTDDIGNITSARGKWKCVKKTQYETVCCKFTVRQQLSLADQYSE